MQEYVTTSSSNDQLGIKKAEAKDLRYYFRFAYVSLCYTLDARLESELVTKCELEYAVLCITTLSNVCHAEVVASVDNDVVKLIAKTNGDREVERLCANIFSLNRSSTTTQLHLIADIEGRLNTELNGQTLSYVHVSKDRNVDIIELGSLCNTFCLSLITLHRVNQASADAEDVSCLIFCLNTCCETDARVTAVTLSEGCYIHTNLRLQCESADCLLCVRCYLSLIHI